MALLAFAHVGLVLGLQTIEYHISSTPNYPRDLLVCDRTHQTHHTIQLVIQAN